MSHRILVRPHALGVVVFDPASGRSELLIPGEACCGVSYEQLEEHARTGSPIEVSDAAASNCILRPRQRRAT
ncbi:MAG: hypothetical protein HZC24_17185 [Rhodocyclales bacterium]|nr:hypothetical protein [Rhodocyclales bacterium]